MAQLPKELLTGPQTETGRFGVGLFLILALSMMATRDYHFSTALHLADTSWAVFLLAGLYLRPRWALPALLGIAVAVDLFAFWQDGAVRIACFSPAYPGLMLAYAALWGAGRLARRDWRSTGASSAQNTPYWLVPIELMGWTVAGVVTAFAISNLTFWAFSGHFTTMSLAAYASQVIIYLSGYLSTTAAYILVTLLAIASWSAIMARRRDRVRMAHSA